MSRLKYRSCPAAAIAGAREWKNSRCVSNVSFSFGLRGRRRRRRGTTRQAFPLRAALPSRPTLRPGTSRSAQESRLHRTPTPNNTFPPASPPPSSSPPPASVSPAHPIRAASHASARRRPVSSITRPRTALSGPRIAGRNDQDPPPAAPSYQYHTESAAFTASSHISPPRTEPASRNISRAHFRHH